MHENASKPLDPPPGVYACYNIITMAHHFAKWMASPQFNHNCDSSCKTEAHKKKKSILKKILEKIGKK